LKDADHLDTSSFSPANRKRLSAPALRTFLAIADLWGLTEEQRLLVLGYPSGPRYRNWAKQAREHGVFTLDVDTLTRISVLFGIHQVLGVLFRTERLGVEWLRTAHNAAVFSGRPPLDLVTNGTQDGLLTVRRFLEGARGGVYMHPNVIDETFLLYDEESCASSSSASASSMLSPSPTCPTTRPQRPSASLSRAPAISRTCGRPGC